jgi:hypothetical protein
MNNFSSDMKMVRTRSFRKAYRDANTFRMPADVSHIHSAVLFASGGLESASMHKAQQHYSRLLPGSKRYFYPQKKHGWLAQDEQTHIGMCRHWLLGEPLPPALCID